MFAVDLRIN
uniref:Uncharacterized protein n=1 Tax=Anguilla anguilla TaxID=7936 RepID=A0A0E9TZD2_ANGAN